MSRGDGVPAQERRSIHKSGIVVRGVGVPSIVADVARFTRGELLELRERVDQATLGCSKGEWRNESEGT